MNYEDSLYIIDGDFTKYKNVKISFDLLSRVEDGYDNFRANLGSYDGNGRFQDDYVAFSTYKDVDGSINVGVPDNRLSSLLAFRFTSDYAIPDNGVRMRNLLITGDRIADPDIPPVAAVPEPATWAMMISGFGAVGGLLRRRKNRGSYRAALT